jgi:hypothetical protein
MLADIFPGCKNIPTYSVKLEKDLQLLT